jgi:large subunit ribosomal protein L7/L12
MTDNTHPDKFKSLVEQIEQMSVLDLIEFTKILQEKFGVSAIAAQSVIASGTSTSDESNVQKKAAAEEKPFFNIELQAVGDNKIEIIKAIRNITGKGLKESKDLIDVVAGGETQIVKEKVKKEEAEEIKKTLEAVGAKVKMA